MTGACNAPRTVGMSFRNNWSCSVFVPVDTITLPPHSSAGTRYAKVFPVPVPASAISVPHDSIAAATASAISLCPRRAR